VLAQGRLASVEDFENVVVRATPDGSIVRLRDVARVELGEQSYYRDARLTGAPRRASPSTSCPAPTPSRP